MVQGRTVHALYGKTHERGDCGRARELTYDPEFEELDEAFETDDRYAVPLATYLLYRLRVARLHRNVRRRSRAVWRVFIQVAMLGQYVQVFDAFDPLLTELQQEVMILLHGEYVKKSNAKGNKAWSSRI